MTLPFLNVAVFSVSVSLAGFRPVSAGALSALNINSVLAGEVK